MYLESALIKEVRRKDRKALEELHDRYAPSLLGICLRYCGNRPDAEDVLHDSFIRIITHLESFEERPDCSFEGWMKRITVHTALNFLRDKNRKFRWIDPDPVPEIPDEDDDEELTLAGLAGHLNKEEILSMILDLPPGYRSVFNLYVFEEYSHREIAETLSCTENNSKSQLSKARSLLRKKIAEVVSKQNHCYK